MPGELERFAITTATCEAAAQRRLAGSERDTAFFLRNDRPYGLKRTAFHTGQALEGTCLRCAPFWNRAALSAVQSQARPHHTLASMRCRAELAVTRAGRRMSEPDRYPQYRHAAAHNRGVPSRKVSGQSDGPPFQVVPTCSILPSACVCHASAWCHARRSY